MDNAANRRFSRFLRPTLLIAATATLAGAVALAPLPQTIESLAIYLSAAILGLLAWVVRTVIGHNQTEILRTQERIAQVLDNHLGAISAHMAASSEILRQVQDTVAAARDTDVQLVKHLTVIATAVAQIQAHLLSAALRTPTRKRGKS